MSTDLRKIDALIAEHVYGWTVREGWKGQDGTQLGWPPNEASEAIPRYSTDLALAIGVLEKLRTDKDWGWSIATVSWDWRIEINLNVSPSGKSEVPLPEAICRHVLTVLGVPFETRPGGAS